MTKSQQTERVTTRIWTQIRQRWIRSCLLYKSNDDGTVWTFHRRDNKWSDGEPVTADDYVYGMKQTLDPEAGSPNAFYITCIKNGEAIYNGEKDVSELGVKAVDDKTLEITLEYSVPYFLSLTDTRAMYPVREDLVEK